MFGELAADLRNIRLTLRGKIVFGVLGVALVIGLTAALAVTVISHTSRPAQAVGLSAKSSCDHSCHRVIVGPGESLWVIADRHAAGRDVRDVAIQISQVNDLASPNLRVGQELLIPTAH